MRRQHALILLACLAAGLAIAPASPHPGLRPASLLLAAPHRRHPRQRRTRSASSTNKPSELQLYYAVNRGAVPEGPEAAAQQHAVARRRQEGVPLHRRARRRLRVRRPVHLPRRHQPTREADELSPQQRDHRRHDPAGGEGLPVEQRRGVGRDRRQPRPARRDAAVQVADRAASGRRSPTARSARPTASPGSSTRARCWRCGCSPRTRPGTRASRRSCACPPDGANGVGLPAAVRRARRRTGSAAASGSEPARSADRLRQHAQVRRRLHHRADGPLGREGRASVRPQEPGRLELAKQHSSSSCRATRTRRISLPYEAQEEGTYGFYVIPESGAGKRGADPRRGDPPMLHVVVDTTAPYVQITGVQVRPGGARGPLVEINWEVADPNLMPQPDQPGVVARRQGRRSGTRSSTGSATPRRRRAASPGKCPTRTCGSSTSARGRWTGRRTPANTSGARTRRRRSRRTR